MHINVAKYDAAILRAASHIVHRTMVLRRSKNAGAFLNKNPGRTAFRLPDRGRQVLKNSHSIVDDRIITQHQRFPEGSGCQMQHQRRLFFRRLLQSIYPWFRLLSH